MAISQKRASVVKDAYLGRIISKIYDDLNELINAVNQGNTTLQKLTEKGKSGDIRLRKDSEGSYFLEGKTDEGWVETSMTFRERD